MLDTQITAKPSRLFLGFLSPEKGFAAMDTADRLVDGPEHRERVYRDVTDMAHAKALHVAPAVTLGGMFAMRDGRKSRARQGAQAALAHERVDILVLDRHGQPLLAIDHYRGPRPRNFLRRRLTEKEILFERAGLPLLELREAAHWSKDRDRVLEAIAEAAERGYRPL